MITPFKVSILSVGLNIALNLILMQWFKQGGIALATVLASLFSNGALIVLLLRKYPASIFHFGELFRMLAKALLACAAAGYASKWIMLKLDGRFFGVDTSSDAIVQCASGCVVFGMIYFGLSILFRMKEAHQFLLHIPGIGKRFKSH